VKIHYNILIISALVFLESCALTTHYTGYRKGNLKVVGTRNAYENTAVFLTLRVYNKRDNILKPIVMKNVTPFLIKLPNKKVILSTDFNYSTILHISDIINKYVNENSISIILPGYKFIFNKEKQLIYFTTIKNYKNHIDFQPEIGNPNDNKFYKFPMTQDQLESILGKPDQYENKHS